MSRHDCCKLFPQIMEALVVARQSDVLSDRLRIKALTEMKLAVSDQGKVGTKFITGNPVELANHRCKWGGCSNLRRESVSIANMCKTAIKLKNKAHQLFLNAKLLHCLLRQEVFVDVSTRGFHRILMQANHLRKRSM